MKRRLTAFLLCVCMMISLCPVTAFADTLEGSALQIDDTGAFEPGETTMTLRGGSLLASGTCGKNANWSLDEDGLLTVFGSGDMDNYDHPFHDGPKPPWQLYVNDIKSIVVGSEITHIGSFAFYGTTAESFAIQNASLSMGQWSLGYNIYLTDIAFGNGTISPGDNVFTDCDALETVHIPSGVVMNGAGMGNGSGYELFYSCDSLQTAIVDCAYIGPFLFETDPALQSVTFTDPDVKIHYLETNGSGNPFKNTSGVTIVGYTCSDVPKFASRIHFQFTPIENDPGHDYSTIDYAWSDDYSSVTATAICSRNTEHVLTETVATTSEVTKEPTATEYGETTYTAAFSDATFTIQSKTVANIPPAVEVGLFWRWPKGDWSTGDLVLSSDEDARLQKTVYGEPYGVQDREFVYRDQNGTLTTLHCADLVKSGNFFDMQDFQDNFIRMSFSDFNEGALSYQGYSIPVICDTPDFGFYNTSLPAQTDFLAKWVYDGTNKTIYFVKNTSFTMSNLRWTGGSEVEYALDPSGDYATATLVGHPTDNYTVISYDVTDEYGNTWQNNLSLDIIDNSPTLPEFGFYSSATPSAETILSKWDYDGTNHTIYFVADRGASISSIVEISGNAATINLDPSCAFAEIQITSPLDTRMGVRYSGLSSNGEILTDQEVWIELDDSTVIASGSCVDYGVVKNRWTLYSDGLLKITGNGPMMNYYGTSEKHPWRAYSGSVKRIVVEEGVTTLSTSAFVGFYLLTEVSLPDSLTEVGTFAFSRCSALSYIYIPENVTTIGGAAFNQCEQLKTIDIPKGISTIGIDAFRDCAGLESVSFYGSVDSVQTTIEDHAFLNCSSLQDVYYAGTQSEWDSISIVDNNTALINAEKHFVNQSGSCGDNAIWTLYDDGTLIISGSGDMYDYAEPGNGTISPWTDYKNQISSIIIDSGITHIGTAAFYGSSAASVTIRDANLSIGDYAFWNSANLTSIDFGTGTISPGNYVFNNCDALELVHLPVNVVMNGMPSGEGSGFEMFMSCSSLKTAVVDCAYIGRWMFEYCGQLESVTFTNPDVRFYYLDDGGSFSGSGNPFNGIENRTISLIGYSCSEVPRLAAEAGNASASRFLTFVPIENDPGHDYSMIDYVWSDDFSFVTATAICSRNAEHTLTETVTTTSEVTKTPTATEYGETTYTAVFSDTTFTTQTKTIADIPPVVEVGLYWRWPIERVDEETGEFYFVHNDSELPTNEEIVGFGFGTQDIEILYYNEDGQYIPLDYSELQFSGECITASERQRGFITIRYKALGTGTVRYEIGREVYTLTILSTLPDIGFYSSTVPSEETYLTKWAVSEDNDTIYFVSRTDAVLTSVTEISSNGAVITLDPDGKYAAIQVTDPQERDLGIRFTFMDGHHSNDGTWWIDLIDDRPGLYWRWPLEKTDETTGDFYFVPNEDEYPVNEEIVGFGFGSQDVEILYRDEAGTFTALRFSDLQVSGDCIEGSEWQPGFVEIRYKGLGTGSISYETGGQIYTLTVLSELPDIGFYSSTVASEETYLTEWIVTADNNTVYFVARDDKVLTGVTEITSNGAVITLDPNGKYATIQVTDPQEDHLGVRFTFTNGNHSSQGTWWLDLIDNTPVAQGLYWRWPDTTWEDDEPIITSNARASLETILRSFPYGDSFREFVYADENGTLNPVKCSQLTVTGDFFTIEPIQENYVILTCNDFGTGSVSYNGYSVTIESDLPTVGYYDEPAASQAHFIKEWVYDGTNDTIYIVADSGYTILEITDVRGSSFDVTLNSDGSYATAKLLELTDDQFIGVHYRVRDNLGGSWEDAIYITIKDNSAPVITGDADGDGKVGMDDRVLLSRYLAGWPGVAEQIPSINALDINKDGKVNAKDRMILSRYLASWGEPYNSYFTE